MKRFLVLIARGSELRGDVRQGYVEAASASEALQRALRLERDPSGTYRVQGDVRAGDRIWVAEVEELRVLEPEHHRPTLPPDVFVEAPV